MISHGYCASKLTRSLLCKVASVGNKKTSSSTAKYKFDSTDTKYSKRMFGNASALSAYCGSPVSPLLNL